MEPKAQAAERLVRGFGVAIKTFALYPLPHPVTTKAVENLLGSLRTYMDAYGPFAARISKYSLAVDGMPFKGGAHSNLALYLFTRKVASFKIMPAVSEQALGAFVAAVGSARQTLEAQGGVRHLLREAGVGNVQVAEFSMDDDTEDFEPLDLSGVFEVLGRGRQGPHERERVVEILRDGAGEARALLENIYSIAGGGPEAVLDESQVENIYQAVRSLDRVILDEPFEDQPQLFANVANATLTMRAPARSLFLRALVDRQDSGVAARMVGDALTSEQIAQLVRETMTEGEVAPQVATFLRALCSDRQKAGAVLAILDVAMRPARARPNWLSGAVWPLLENRPRRDVELPAEFQFGGLDGPSRPETELRLSEARAVDDESIAREVTRTLVDMLAVPTPDKESREVADVGDALMASIGWLVEHQEYGLLQAVLTALGATATAGAGAGPATAAAVLKSVAEGAVIETMLMAMWNSRDTTLEKEVRACLQPLRDHLVPALIHALGAESRGGVRAMLCDLILEMDADKIDELGRYVTDSRWYLVRNLANVLGRTRNPRAIAYLNQLTRHGDYRVRRETIDALAAIGTPDAQSVLASFLDDRDERIRLRVLTSLDSIEAWRAMAKIVAVLEQRDLFVKQFELKQAALEALARLGAKQSLPAVRRVARTWLMFGPRAPELRRLAALTADIIEGQRPLPPRGFAAETGKREAR
jgi:hypothetical protein